MLSDMVEASVFPVLPALGSPPKVLYHYTTREGILGILQSRSLWATSIRHLNDTSEFFYALEVIQGVLEARLIQEADTPERQLIETFLKLARLTNFPVLGYVFSMSEDPDVLSQWRAYGRPGNAYALGLDTSVLKGLLDPRGYCLAACRYKQSEQEGLVNQIISVAFERYRGRSAKGQDVARNTKVGGVDFGLLVVQAAAFIKSPAFREEREWRLVRSDPETSLSFRAGASMLIPYQVVQLGPGLDALPFRVS